VVEDKQRSTLSFEVEAEVLGGRRPYRGRWNDAEIRIRGFGVLWSGGGRGGVGARGHASEHAGIV